jgi:hypothetical protein
MAETINQLLNELFHGKWLIMKAIADKYEEEGDKIKAMGWRYLSDNKRFPEFTDGKFSWIGVVPRNQKDRPHCRHFLPIGVVSYMRGENSSEWATFKQIDEEMIFLCAVNAIGNLLDQGKKLE